MSDPRNDPGFDPDEDLFDFPEVGQESAVEPEEDLEEILASFREPQESEELLAVPAPAATPRAAPMPPPPFPKRKDKSSASQSLPLARLVEPVAAALPRSEGREPAGALPTGPRGSRISKGVLAVALAVTLVNSILGVVMLRDSTSRHDVQAVGDEAAAARVEPANEEPAAPRAPVRELPDPETTATLPDHPALQAARDEISHGQYAAARQRVYSLLAIIDRLDDVRRESIEAECQFLVAQALHLEALDRMGGRP